MNVLWIKRDARIVDNEALSLAAASSQTRPLMILYVYEDVHLQSDMYHESHHKFINEALVDMDAKIRRMSGTCGQGITFRHGTSAATVLMQMHVEGPKIHTLFSHREVGNHVSLARNQEMRNFTEQAGIRFVECIQDGVSPSRNSDDKVWAEKWNRLVTAPQAVAPTQLNLVQNISCGGIMSAEECGVKHRGSRPEAQHGGENAALDTLKSFLTVRGQKYSAELSSPLTGWTGCSRLSTYLAWGHISVRHIFQEVTQVQEYYRLQNKSKKGEKASSSGDVAKLPPVKSGEPGTGHGGWLKSLNAFTSRIHWRSHFMQKLNDEPQVEFENMVRLYDTIRTEFNQETFDAWIEGRTGFPMVDACMRSLHVRGWINFRMRAFVVSFAAYYLWIDWRKMTSAMARLFMDYEPGIHYPQFQMQSG